MKFADRLKFTVAVTGNSAASISDGTAVAKCRNIAKVISDGGPIVIGDTNVPFTSEDGSGAWEDSLYTVGGTAQAPTLTRTQVMASSAGGTTAATFSGTLTVYNTVPGKILSRVSFDSDVTFSQSVPLTQPGTAYMEPQTNVTSGMVFAPAAGAVKGALAYARLVGNGTDTPNFSAFTPVIGSAGFDPRNGIVNVLQFLYDGHDYWYSASQAANAVAIDGTPPTASSASVANSTPAVVSITMSEAMDTNNVPAASAFTVGGHTVTGVTISPSTVINLTCSTAFVNGEAARTVSYTQPGTSNARDVAGNLLANFSGLAVTNNVAAPGDVTPPTFSSAQVTNSAPNVIVLTFNETLASVTPAAAAFAVSGGRTVTAVGAPSGATISITVNTAYANGDAITVAYTKPGTNPLQDPSGNQVVTFGAQTVTNNVAAGATYDTFTNLTHAASDGATPATYTGDGTATHDYDNGGGTWSKQFAANTDGYVLMTVPTTNTNWTLGVSSAATPSDDVHNVTLGIANIYGSGFGYSPVANTSGLTYAGVVKDGSGNTVNNSSNLSLNPAAGDIIKIERTASASGTNAATMTISLARAGSPTTFVTLIQGTGFYTQALRVRWYIQGNPSATKLQSSGLV